jgi:hypothetical protein
MRAKIHYLPGLYLLVHKDKKIEDKTIQLSSREASTLFKKMYELGYEKIALIENGIPCL